MALRRRRRGPFSLLLLVGAVALASGCAYYNTFYNAKSYYAQGMRLKDESHEGKLTPAAKSHFDKAIEKCAKVIELHPESRWVDEAVLLMGKCFFEEGEYLKALRKFEEVTIYYSAGRWLDDAYYMMGRTYLALEDHPRATAAFDHSLAVAPDREWADDATYWKAASTFATRDYSTAAGQYTSFLETYPRSTYRHQALYERAESLYQLGEFDEAIRLFGELVDRRPGRELAFPASLRIGEACLAMEKTERALAVFEELQGTALEPANEAKLGLRVAACYRSLGEHDAALRALGAVIEGHPRTEEAALASYRKGLIYEEDLSDLELAREAYEQVRRHAPTLEVAFDATERSTSIAELTRYRENLESGGEADLARSQFRLAELYYLGLGDLDQAMVEYEKVLTEYPGSEMAPRAAFALAWILEHERGDEERARTAYREIVTRFPGTVFAERAGAELGDVEGTPEEDGARALGSAAPHGEDIPDRAPNDETLVESDGGVPADSAGAGRTASGPADSSGAAPDEAEEMR